jgi:hypothetical protein
VCFWAEGQYSVRIGKNGYAIERWGDRVGGTNLDQLRILDQIRLLGRNHSLPSLGLEDDALLRRAGLDFDGSLCHFHNNSETNLLFWW